MVHRNMFIDVGIITNFHCMEKVTNLSNLSSLLGWAVINDLVVLKCFS